MLIFSNPEAAARAGFRIVDYDVERQLFVVENGGRRGHVRGHSNYFAVLLDDDES